MATVVGTLRKKHMGEAPMDEGEPLDAPGHKGYSGDALEDYESESDSEEEKEDESTAAFEATASNAMVVTVDMLSHAIKAAGDTFISTGAVPTAERDGSIASLAAKTIHDIAEDVQRAAAQRAVDSIAKATHKREQAKLRKRRSRANIAARLRGEGGGEGGSEGGAEPA